MKTDSFKICYICTLKRSAELQFCTLISSVYNAKLEFRCTFKKLN